MKISINGEMISTVSDLLADVIIEYGATQPYAIAVNGEFVSKSEYSHYRLSDNDKVDIVSPIYGG